MVSHCGLTAKASEAAAMASEAAGSKLLVYQLDGVLPGGRS